MRILINHLTRMHGGHICAAGVDVETRRHVRPVLQQGAIPFHLLGRYGGPFDMARVVDLGAVRPTPHPPHTEDAVFVPSRARPERTACPHEFWNVLHELARTRLKDLFGEALRPVGGSRYATLVGQGEVSLGLLRPSHPADLYVGKSRDGKPQIRMKLSDGQLHLDAGVTDLRLYQADHATPDLERVRGVAKWMYDSQGVILSLGLTRKFRRDEHSPYFHWLQVNNVHLHEEPAWQLL